MCVATPTTGDLLMNAFKILPVFIANGTGLIFIFVQPITARVRMLYRSPLRQHLHAWNMLLTTSLILRTSSIPSNGLKYFRLFRWMSV